MNNTGKFFLVIGTYRAGTTWLQKVFENHPQIFVPIQKEVFFFSRYYERGEVWYNSFFSSDKQYKIAGEICPSYLRNAELTAERIREFNQQCKILAILRNPFDQIESMMRLHSKRNADIDVFNLTNEDLENIYLPNVMYYKNLKPFYDRFSEDQIFVINYDSLFKQPDEFLADIYKFLEVDYVDQDDIGMINTAYQSRSKNLDYLIAQTGEFIRNKNLTFISSFLNKVGVVKTLKKINSTGNKEFLSLSNEQKKFISSALEDDYKQLSKHLGFNFIKWIG